MPGEAIPSQEVLYYMKKHLRIMTVLLIAAAAALLCAVALSRAVYGRSLKATIYEIRLRMKHAHPRSAAEEDARLEALRRETEPAYRLPEDLRFAVGIDEAEWGGLRAFTLNPGGGATTVLYLHGGAYVNSFNAHQWRFLDRLAQTGCEVLAPDYHLTPFGSCAQAYDGLTALYRAWRSAHPGRRLGLMGDSAGGGLALGLAEHLRDLGEPLPERLVLLSPWVDVSMDNPEAGSLAAVEPMLHLDLMRTHGRWWAGALDVHDWRVSPIYGDMEGLPPVTVFCGTRELLYPDILRCCDRLRAAGVEVDLHVGRGLNHDFPLMPIPEAERAFEQIAGLIGNSFRRMGNGE